MKNEKENMARVVGSAHTEAERATASENVAMHLSVSRGDDTRWYIETFGAEWFILNGAGIICQGERDPGAPHDELMARARFVLLACNCFPDLLAALKKCLPSKCQAASPASPDYRDGAPCGKCGYCLAQAAIAKAEGR